MKGKAASFLKQNSLLYSFIRFFYWKLLALQASILGTTVEEKRWVKKNLQELKDELLGLSHPHREFLVSEIGRRASFSEVLEIGCGLGPNLFLLAKKFPQVNFKGIDINRLAIEEGRQWLNKEGITNVKLEYGSFDSLSKFSDKSFDIVFTDAVLMYIGTDKIEESLRQMLRICRKSLLFLEQNYSHNEKDSRGLGVYKFGHWQRHYPDLLKEFVPYRSIHLTKVDAKMWSGQDWGERGYLIEVNLCAG